MICYEYRPAPFILSLKREELWAKFNGCLNSSPVRLPARELFETLMSLDAMPQITELVRLIVPAARDRMTHTPRCVAERGIASALTVA